MLLAELDDPVTGRVHTLITIPRHVRSAEQRWTRYGAEIWGHPACQRRMRDIAAMRPFAAGDRLPCGVTAHAIGSPRRQETPLYVPSHGGLLFGDALVMVGGRLRVWLQAPITDRRMAWYRNRFLPTLEPLRSLGPECRLVRGSWSRLWPRLPGITRRPDGAQARISEKWMTVTVSSSVTSRL